MLLQDGCFKTSADSILQCYWSTCWKRIWRTCTSYWENCNSFWGKCVVPAAKLVGADVVDVAVPEIAEIVSCKKFFETAAQNAGRQNLRKHMASGRGNRKANKDVQQASRVLSTKPGKQNRDILKTFLIDHGEQFSVPNFCGSFWKSWMESPSN